MDCWLPVTIRALSPRQREIVRLHADGLTLAQTAERLGISIAWVEQASASASRRLRLMSETRRMAEIWPERAREHENAPAAKE